MQCSLRRHQQVDRKKARIAYKAQIIIFQTASNKDGWTSLVFADK